jgi:hypothetical protein
MLCLHYTLCLMQLSVVRNLILMGCSDNIPVGGLLVIDAVGWRSMYFVVMPRVNLIVMLVTYACYLYSINCPTVICLPSICYLSYGETPLVNCGPRSNFLYIAITCLLYSHYLLSERACAPCVVLVINDNLYGLMFALSCICRTCP